MAPSTRPLEHLYRRPFGAAWRLWPRACTPLLATVLLLATPSVGAPARARTVEEFGADVELAPFVVRGEQLAISIHARSKRDRKYAEGFATEVLGVVHEGVTPQTGKGLVIVGAKGEPHPVAVFRKFQAMAAAGELDREVAGRVAELGTFLDLWRDAMQHEVAAEPESSGELDLDYEEIVHALPLPLEGVGAKLYQIAWAERFDEQRLAARYRSLRMADLEGGMFARFDWVFYLPPRGVFDRVIDGVIAQALKEEDLGFFARNAVRTVLVLAKPVIRRAVEGMRKGVLLMTVVRAQTEYTDPQAATLMVAYIEVLMPGSKTGVGGSPHERAVHAVRGAVEELRTSESSETG